MENIVILRHLSLGYCSFLQDLILFKQLQQFDRTYFRLLHFTILFYTTLPLFWSVQLHVKKKMWESRRLFITPCSKNDKLSIETKRMYDISRPLSHHYLSLTTFPSNTINFNFTTFLILYLCNRNWFYSSDSYHLFGFMFM